MLKHNIYKEERDYPQIDIFYIIQNLKKYGFLQFLKSAFKRLGFVSFNRTIKFLALKFNDIPNDIPNVIRLPYSFYIASIDDIQNEQDYYDGWFTKQEAINRIQSGHRLFVFKQNEKMVYFLWAELRNVTIRYFDMSFHIPDDVIYITGIYTLPEFRNRGIATKLKREIINYLKEDGVKRIIEVVDPLNTTALEIDKKLGFREYQMATYKRYWHIRHYNVQKFNSDECKTFIDFFKAPKCVWKTFL